MIRNILSLIAICLLISNVYTEAVNATEIQSTLTFLQDSSNLSLDINQILKCATTVTGVASRAYPIVEDLMAHPEHIFQSLTQITGFYNEIVAGCSGVFNATILNEVADRVVNTKFLAAPQVGKMPAISDIITCVKSIKPVATDIYNAVIAFKDGKTSEGLAALEQVVIDGATLGFSCGKVISDIISE